MNETITLRWNTGCMELVPSALLTLSAAQLAKIVKQATINAEEVKAQISAYIQGEIDKIDARLPWNKKTVESYKKLLAAVDGKKKTKVEKIMEKVIKGTAYDEHRGTFEDAGKCCVIDGYRIFRFAEPLNGLPKADKAFNTVRAIGDISAYSVRLELPTIKNLKSDIKIAKMSGADVNRIHIKSKGRKIGFMYDFGYGLPLVDALALVDMMEALPDCEAYTLPHGANCPIYFVSGDNDGFLLHLTKRNEWEPAPIAEEKPVNNTPVTESPAVDTAPAPVQDVPAVKEAPAPDRQAANASSAPVQTAQDTAAPEARQIVTSINPAILRLFCGLARHRCRPDRNGLDRTKPDKSVQSAVSACWTLDGRTVHNTS